MNDANGSSRLVWKSSKFDGTDRFIFLVNDQKIAFVNIISEPILTLKFREFDMSMVEETLNLII